MNGMRDALKLIALMAGAVGLFPQLVLTAAVVLAGAAVAAYLS